MAHAQPHRQFRGTLAALAFLLLLLGLCPSPSVGQYFGQNKVQYREFDWAVLKTEHFEIYFHDGEKDAAVDAGRMAERAYERLSTILDHEFSERIPVILYASQTEFQQSNVTPSMISEGTGGFTEFAKRRVALPITGSYRDFDHVLTHELVHAFQLDIIAGGSTHGTTSPFRAFPPLWFAEGMAEYLSLGEVDPQTEMWLRDGALRGYLTPIPVLEQIGDIRVYRYGQGILAYLGATYGDHTLGEILKRLPHSRGLNRAFEDVVGMTLEKFSQDWTESIRKQYLPTIRDHQKPEEFAFRLTEVDRDLSNMNVTPAVSPDGSNVIYFSDRSLYNDLYLASALSGRVQKRLVKGERKEDFESLRFYTSAMDFSPDGSKIVFVAMSRGQDALHIQRIRDGQIVRRIRFDLDGAQSPSFSPDGEWIVFAGLKGGRSNLYRVRSDATGLEQLTSDRFLAAEPRYAPDGKSIIFVTDSGPGAEPENLLFALPQLALFDIETRRIEVLPRQAGRNISPHLFPDGRHVAFISDRSGIANLYIRDLTTNEDRRISDVLTGIGGITAISPAMSLARSGKRLVFSAFSRGSWDLYAIKDPLSLWEKATPWTGPFTEPIVQTVPPKAQEGKAPGDALAWLGQGEDAFPGSPAPERNDEFDGPGAGSKTPAGTPEPDREREPDGEQEQPDRPDSQGSSGRDREPGSATGAVPERSRNAESAKMDSLMRQVVAVEAEDSAQVRPLWRGLPSASPSDSSRTRVDVAEVLSRKKQLPDPDTFELDSYHPHFTADYVSANGFFAGNVGLAAQSVIQFSDLLGDQIILIGANVYGSIADSDLLLEYVNMRKRTNWGVSAYQFRSDFYTFAPGSVSDEFVSQIYRGANLTLQRPFSRFRRIEWSIEGLSVAEEQYQETLYGDRIGATLTSKRNYAYVAPGLALVTDNTLYGSTGPIGGGRDRLSAQVGIGDLSFTTAMMDFRRYLNVYQRYALATRFLGASSVGRDPQYFRIGGPYTIRGYDFGEFRGTKALIANVEFRFPLIENLSLGFPLPLSIGGVRGALFFDAGAAFDDASALRVFRYSQGHDRLEDVKASYGLSAGMNIGFTVLKWDLAWRTDLSRNLGPARGYLSFGLDY